MVWVSIIGAYGYVGHVLSKLIAAHPAAQISTYIDMAQLHDRKTLGGAVQDKAGGWSMFDAIEKADVIFNGIPKKDSANIYTEALKQGKKIIDISMDSDAMLETIACSSFGKTVYGLPELNKAQIKHAEVVSNPSSYCTGAMLGLAPLISGKRIDAKSIIIDSKSGISSLSKNDKLLDSFMGSRENVKAYTLGNSTYSNEIEGQVHKLFGEEIAVTYTPYIVPMNKGILTTIYATPLEETDASELTGLYKAFYESNSFIRVYDAGKVPETKAVSHSNYCDIGISYDPHTNKIVVVTAIDNLIKGAAGQAIQNMNLMYGMDEKLGLQFAGALF